jgi:hypothetical protein
VAVTYNLLSPELSGPKTSEGKRIASLNRVKHGLSRRGFLPCKKHRCFFCQLCELSQSDEGRELLSAIEYESPCPLEQMGYIDIKEDIDKYLNTHGIADSTLSSRFAMNEILKERRRKLSALEPELVRQVPLKGTSLTRPAFAPAMRYESELSNEHDKILGRLQSLLSGICCSSKHEDTKDG